MKKISLFKIIAALVICNAYIFTCGVMGTVRQTAPVQETEDTSSDVQTAPLPEADSEDTDQANGQGTVDFLVPDESGTGSVVKLELMSFQQPSMADRVIYTTAQPIENQFPEELDTFDVIIPEDEYDWETVEQLIIPDEPEETTATTAATTTTPATTTTAATTTTTPATTTTTPATTTTPPATTTAATTTTPATTTTTPNVTVDPYAGGIPVEDTTVSVPEELPDVEETEEADVPARDHSGAASELLYIKSNGAVVSGTALDIVAGVTQTEVGTSFSDEAIKAQAVAAYTYIMYYNKHGMYPNVAVSSNVDSHVRELVSSVIGEAVYYNGELAQTVYSASSAGYTASSLNVWGNDYPYLTSKYCELDELYDPNYGRTATFSSSEISSRVYNKTGISLSGDPSTWITIEGYIEGKYVGQLNIGGYHSYTDSDGDAVKLTGRVFREKIMDFDIRSHAFDISYDAGTDTFTITTYGYGHGVGMSQNGANALAKYWGYDYRQILKYYYVGCEVY